MLDLSHFPIIVFTGDGADATADWAGGFAALLQRDACFVLIITQSHDDVSAQQRRERALFFKANRRDILRLCKGIVAVEANGAKRTVMAAMAAGFSRAFGLACAVEPDLEAAWPTARAMAESIK